MPLQFDVAQGPKQIDKEILIHLFFVRECVLLQEGGKQPRAGHARTLWARTHAVGAYLRAYVRARLRHPRATCFCVVEPQSISLLTQLTSRAAHAVADAAGARERAWFRPDARAYVHGGLASGKSQTHAPQG